MNLSELIEWTDFKTEQPLDGQWCVFIAGITDEETGEVTEDDPPFLLMGKYNHSQEAFIDPDHKNIMWAGIVKYATLKSILNIENG